jgi:hypothetical protein
MAAASIACLVEQANERPLVDAIGKWLKRPEGPRRLVERRQCGDGADVSSWPTPGALPVDFIATLPTASLHLQWLLWSRKIEKSYDSCQSAAAFGKACLNHGIRSPVIRRLTPADAKTA